MDNIDEELFNQIIKISKCFQWKNLELNLPSAMAKERLLLILSKYPEGMKMKDLAKEACIKLPTASELIHKLGEDINSQISTEDKRVHILTLSDSGKKRVEKILQARKNYIEQCFSSLNPSEKSMLLACFNKIMADANNSSPENNKSDLNILKPNALALIYFENNSGDIKP